MEPKSKHFSEREKNELLNIIEDYRNIIENKKTDKTTAKAKAETWEKIAMEYNALNHLTRNPTQLKTLYKNMKSKTRQQLHNGGGVYKPSITENSEQILGMPSHQFKPLDSEYDSSASYFSPIMPDMETEELGESELGTQEYWDSCYKTQVNNFRNHGDVGDVWFGEDSMDRVCSWIFKNESITKNSRIIDLGCGNGMFLIDLAREGYENLIGVDYSADAIVLSNEIAKKTETTVTYQVFDILDTNTKLDKCDVVHDKGTYDAISLSSNAKESRQTYINQVYSLLENHGFFIITSCNWTHSELIAHFETKFKLHSVIPTPEFKFGGQTGNIVTSVVFKKIL